MASSYGAQWKYLYSEEEHIEGLEMFCADGSVLNVIRYIDNGYASLDWSWMVREAAGQGYNVVASYDDDIYFDDIDSAYAALMDFLSDTRSNLLPQEHVSTPGRARLHFLEKALACGFAVAIAFNALIGTATTAFADDGSSPITLEVVAVEDSDQAIYTIHERNNPTHYYVGDEDMLRFNISNTAEQQVEIDGMCSQLDYSGVVYDVGRGVCSVNSPDTVWVETEKGLRFEVFSPELAHQIKQMEVSNGTGWIPFTSFTVPEEFADAFDYFGVELVDMQVNEDGQDTDFAGLQSLAAVGAFVAWGAVYAFFVRRSTENR